MIVLALPGLGSRGAPGRIPIELRTSGVHVDGSSVEFGTVQSSDSLYRGRIVRHLDKGKAPGLARLAIRHDAEPFHGAMFLKDGSDVLFGGIGTEISHKNIVHLVFRSN